MESVESKIKELILNRYKSIRDFSITIGVPNSTIDSVLKRGVNNANITNLIKICNGLDIDCESLYYGRILPKQELLKTSPLSKKEQEHIKKYRSLSENDKKAVNDLIDTLSSKPPFGYNSEINAFEDADGARAYLKEHNISLPLAVSGKEDYNDDDICTIATEAYKNSKS